MWKTITNYPNYLISDKGEIFNQRTKQMMKQYKDKDGYLVLNLSHKGSKKQYKVHRLVAQAYLPNPSNLNTVNHINHNKEDNTVSNLEWLSNLDNATEGANSYIRHKGEKATAAKLSMEQAREIREKASIGISRKELATMYKVTTATIGNVINNKVYLEGVG